MREIRRLRPGTDNKQFLEFEKSVRKSAFALLEPHKKCGRSHLAPVIGSFFFEHHNEMTKVCAGIKKMPAMGTEQVSFSIDSAVAVLLVGAMVKMVENPNTQWDDTTMFYYQLQNHLENLQTNVEAALVIELPGGN